MRLLPQAGPADLGPPMRRSTDRSGSSAVIYPATDAEQRFCRVFVAVLVVISALAAAGDQRHVIVAVPAFLSAFAGMTGGADALTAALLFNLYRIDGSRILLAAATAYCINALLTLPYGLTFPGVIDAHGFIGNEQSAAFLWITWHVTFPLTMVAGRARIVPQLLRHRRRDALLALAGCLAFAAIATVLVTVDRDALPTLVHAGAFSPLFSWLALFASLANLVSAGLLLRAAPIPALHVWLIVALFASALDTALNCASPGRYSVPWYVGKLLTFVTSSVVLFSLLAAWSRLQTGSAALAQRLSLTLTDGQHLQQELKAKREIAAALQRALLPSALPKLDTVTLSAAYRPAMHELEIGGDWYDAFLLADGRLAFSIGDVLGHGLAASVVMGQMRFALRMVAAMFADPSLMLTIADATLRTEHPEMTVTAFMGVLDQQSGRLEWASAGHPPVMIRRSDRTIVELNRRAPPLGLYDVATPSAVTLLEPASLLVAYTDGLIECDQDIVGGLARVRSALADGEIFGRTDPATRLFESIVRGAVRDDVAVMTLFFHGAGGA